MFVNKNQKTKVREEEIRVEQKKRKQHKTKEKSAIIQEDGWTQEKNWGNISKLLKRRRKREQCVRKNQRSCSAGTSANEKGEKIR